MMLFNVHVSNRELEGMVCCETYLGTYAVMPEEEMGVPAQASVDPSP